MTRLIIFIAVILLVLCMTAYGREWFQDTQFIEDEQGDEKTYSIDFISMNTIRTHELSLEKNDILQVEIINNRGNIKLTIQGKDGYEAYTGNRLISCDFTVGVPESGKYIVTVEGENADGSIRIFEIFENKSVIGW